MNPCKDGWIRMNKNIYELINKWIKEKMNQNECDGIVIYVRIKQMIINK